MVHSRPSRSMRISFFTLLTLALVAEPFSLCHAQVAGGTILGTVSDTSGSVMANAHIAFKDVLTSEVRSVTTDSAGFYSAPNLLPGRYEVTASAQGFTTEIRSGLVLTVGAELVLNITMQLGQISQTVTVTTEVPVVQLASSTIGSVIDSNTIRELPLNGRDWTQLATLAPGVAAVNQIQSKPDTSAMERGQRGFGVYLSISGNRPQQNNFRLDGISVNDYANAAPASVQGAALGVDSIQEFSVLTSNYTAEYGRTSGGVVNAITRSGTNQFHGSAYEFFRNSALDAANFFDNFSNSPKPPFKRNQFGASAGGPIRKDKTFIFGDYEGLRQSLGTTALDTVPSQDARNGIIHNADGSTTPIVVDPKVAPYLPLWPLPNQGLLGLGNTGLYSFASNEVTSENFATVRVDHRISERDSLYGTWQTDKAALRLPDTLKDLITGNATSSQLVSIEESHIFNPELVNSFRVGYHRDVATSGNTTAINPLTSDPSLGAFPGATAPQIHVTGLTIFGGGTTNQSVNRIYYNSFQGYDDAFLTIGNQSLKFGAGVERIDQNSLNSGRPGGLFIFGSLTDFLTNQPQSVSSGAIDPSKITERGFRQTVFGAYIQDDIRWRPNLTLNVGLRYEMATDINEVQDKLTSLHDVYTDPAPTIGRPLLSNPSLKDFQPRLGFAWDPFRNGKTSVRGAFGLFDTLPLIYQFVTAEQGSQPFLEEASASNLAPGSFPSEALAVLSAGSQLRTAYIEQHPPRSYVETWNLSLQRELRPNLTGMLAYVGSHGVHQPFHADDMNIVLPAQTSAGYLWPYPHGSGTLLNPFVGRIDTDQWSNSTLYDGLQSQLILRLSHGVQFQVSYTWSKAIDEGSASAIGDPFLNSITSLFFFDPRVRRGLSDYNVGQNLVGNYIWRLPSVQSLGGPIGLITKGWELGGILTVQSGLPFTPLIGGDPLGVNSSDPFGYPNRLSGPGCKSLVNPGNVNYIKLNCYGLPMATPAIAGECTPFQPGGPPNPVLPGTCSNLLGNSGRNSIIGPGLVNFDFSLLKNTYIPRISESFNVQFRAEFFNIFNRANFSPPIDNSYLFDQTGASVPGAGMIDQTSTTARELQFAIKFIW